MNNKIIEKKKTFIYFFFFFDLSYKYLPRNSIGLSGLSRANAIRPS